MLGRFALPSLIGLFLATCFATEEKLYRFLHRGHCNNGYACNDDDFNGYDCNTVEDTLMDCRNRCERLGKHIGYFAYVPRSTCACYTRCENDGRYLDHFGFQILRPNCVVAEVGLGKGSKTIEMESEYQCPKLVDKTNWMDGHTWPDKYSVDRIRNKINVTRIDSTDGWGMNLRFQCCKDEYQGPELDCHRMDWQECLKFDGPCCMNGGNCMESSSTPKNGNICSCPHRYIGQYCEIDTKIDSCANYCLNGGTCVVDANGAPRCNCLQTFDYDENQRVEYEGIRCEIRKLMGASRPG